MANLDTSNYDLTTNQGQQDLLNDIIVEQNNQFDQSPKITKYKVVAYKELSITTIADLAPKTYITQFNHGLGFNPTTIAFIKNVTEFSPLPDSPPDLTVGPPYLTPTNAYITVDNQNVYFNIASNGSTGETRTAAIYVFNIPAIF